MTDDPGGRGITRLCAAASDGIEPLLARYAPQLVVLPEDLVRDGPPGPTGGHDYHPRSARLFVDHSRSVPIRPGRISRFDVRRPIRDRLGRRNLPRLGGKAVRRRLEAAWPGRLAEECLTLPGGVDSRSAWRLYRRLLGAAGARYPRTLYGRIVPAGALVAVQYWLFFFFNAWHNVHEADWELVTVLHEPRLDRPVSVTASEHGVAAHRAPDAVTWDGRAPVLWVAGGSHALYFEPEDGDDDRRTTTGIGSPRLRLGAGSTRDWVADVRREHVAELPPVPYELDRLPDVGGLHPGADAWPAWWWLAYGGRWGRRAPIPGPAGQGIAWDDPGRWADPSSAAADAGVSDQPRP